MAERLTTPGSYNTSGIDPASPLGGDGVKWSEIGSTQERLGLHYQSASVHAIVNGHTIQVSVPGGGASSDTMRARSSPCMGLAFLKNREEHTRKAGNPIPVWPSG
jgi:hypothetical protein